MKFFYRLKLNKIFLFVSIIIIIIIYYLTNYIEPFNSNHLVLIHISKCGGTTIEEEMKKAGIEFTKFHFRKPNYIPGNKYLIIIRNPIERFISAFNFRYKVLTDDINKRKNDPQEWQLIQKYGSVYNLVKNIDEYEKNPVKIKHIENNINYYLKDFLSVCPANDIVGVIATETINQDMMDLFGITIHTKENENSGYSRDIPENIERLKQFLKPDYDCIDKLYEMKLLSEEKYSILSK